MKWIGHIQGSLQRVNFPQSMTYEVPIAARDPRGMLVAGFWRSPLILNPAITPVFCRHKCNLELIHVIAYIIHIIICNII